MTRQEFLRVLLPDGYVDLRALLLGQPADQKIYRATDLAAIEAFVARWRETRNIYVGVASRGDDSSGAGHNLVGVRALHVDMDFKDFASEEEARRTLLAFEPRPNIVVNSGGGLQAYWVFKNPLPLWGRDDVTGTTRLEDVKRLLRALCVPPLRGDVRSAEPAHVMRLPDTFNYKYTPIRPVEIEVWNDGPFYDIEDLREALKDALAVTSSSRQKVTSSTPLPATVSAGSRNDALCSEAGRLRRIGLNEAAIAAALKEINREKCRPPLDDREVEGIAHSVAGYEAAEDAYPRTEAGDAEHFAAYTAPRLKYDHRRGCWLLFNGHHWVQQTNGEVTRLALASIRERQAAALRIEDDEKRKQLLNWSIGGESLKRLRALMTIAQNVASLADAGDCWDLDPWLLGVQNGVLDLRTGELGAGRPEDRITLCTSVSFDARATSPLWDATLEQIFGGDADLIAYFDRLTGYTLTGDCREEMLALCYGGGGNGKGTVMNTLAWVMGDYADDLPFSALELHDRSGIPNDIAKIVGKRLITSSESGEAKRLNEARVKALTGRDPITARFLRREFFTFRPNGKFWLVSRPTN
jgi:hypothetical protein